MVFLPEAADFLGTSREETVTLAETLDGEFFKAMRDLSTRHKLWLSIGSMHRKVSTVPVFLTVV